MSPTVHPSQSRPQWIQFTLLGALLLGALPGSASAANPATVTPAVATTRGVVMSASTRAAATKWGVQPVSMRLAAGGYLVYFRYKVTDAARAKPLFKDGLQPRVLDRKSGQALSMPSDTKLGGLRSSPRTTPTNGREYYVLFSNPAKAVGHGSHLDVTMGELTLKDLAVE